MTPERTQAYRRVMQTIQELGPTKLLGSEQERLRAAADVLLFSTDPLLDDAGRDALEDTERLCRALVDNGRWEPVTAMRLADDVSQCGPPLLPDLELVA